MSPGTWRYDDPADVAGLRHPRDGAAMRSHYRESMTSRSPSKIVLVGVIALAPALMLTACATTQLRAVPSDDQETRPPVVTDSSPGGVGLPTAPGFEVGEIPPVPLLTLPDLSLLDASLSGFTLSLATAVGDHPGVTVSPASCDEAGRVRSGDGSVYLYGDGSGTYAGPDGSSQNYGDGSGSYVIAGVELVVYGDGSGVYSNGDLEIVNYGDGGGRWADGTTEINVYGDGSGVLTSADETIVNYGDGAGTSTIGDIRIVNYGDGAGLYDAPGLKIVNWGDGGGTVNSMSVDMEPLADVPILGTFPPMGLLDPIVSCGTTITIDSGALFDFDRFDIRPDAAVALDSVTAALLETGAPTAIIGGHTDSIGDEGENRELSQRRATAVVDALESRGVTTSLDVEGYGETRPVAPNETAAGDDNPAGRQLNRRVEIFVPAF